ncbi:hypothetical protein NQ176_g3832 [Zarea fungicola]|uniref:Uncharacterized protein n=1 Tax=Zarea fungicola TaxID=93591 RepID=A0ACC1NHS0_9HYPO|nr:hypothetical protein NQ176_g3832 [Lecanicillium fungicola]
MLAAFVAFISKQHPRQRRISVTKPHTSLTPKAAIQPSRSKEEKDEEKVMKIVFPFSGYPEDLSLTGCSENEIRAALDAINGKGLALNLDHPLGRAATIRGIRSHLDYARGPEITSLCTGEERIKNPDFVRARNARLIMSNQIPTSEELGVIGETVHDDPETTGVPYCIWHPEFATEDTYRDLALRYPVMRYQVGRACAAAGLDQLYDKLGLLPDVSIAEEARESKTPGGRRIYEKVMSAPVRYAIMNDYTRSINAVNPKSPAFLNGDTNVLHTLEYSCYPAFEAHHHSPGARGQFFLCITETKGIKVDTDGEGPSVKLNYEELQLLYTPLPLDLPTLNKTLLIEMAAYNGDVDRYARLVRPYMSMLEAEAVCVVRGIHHSPLFARFWALQLDQDTQLAKRIIAYHRTDIQKAILARRIMSNDRSLFENGWDPSTPQPYMIWWPQKPHPHTLVDLFTVAPTMRETAIVASIMCDYEGNFEYLDYTPTDAIYLAARESSNPMYMKAVLERAEELGIDVSSRYGDVERPYAHQPEAWIMAEIEPSEQGYVCGTRYDGVVVEGGQDPLHTLPSASLRNLHRLIWLLPLGPDEAIYFAYSQAK